MRTPTEIAVGMHEPHPFANATSYDLWAENWCYCCAHEDFDSDSKFCPILAESIAQAKTPAEWLLGQVTDSTDTYICIEFSHDRMEMDQ